MFSESPRFLAFLYGWLNNVFGDNTAAQIAQMTPTLSGNATAGFTGTILIGVPA